MARPSLVDDLLIGRALNHARRRRGLRQSEVAIAAGISVRTLQDYEHGRSTVPASRRQRLAEALGLDPACLAEPVPTAPLSPDEAAWLALYHRLPPWVRALFRRRFPASQPAAPAQEPVRC